MLRKGGEPLNDSNFTAQNRVRMKHVSLGLNIVLVAAVAVLFYLHFSGKKSVAAQTMDTKSIPSGNSRIAYFEIDSIQTQFEYYKEIQKGLEAKDQEVTKQLNALKSAFATKYQDLQRNAQSLTQAELASRQQELQQMDKTYTSKEHMLTSELQEESIRKRQDVQKKIKEFLEEYNKTKGYTYIFSNLPDLLYYKDTAYDITNDVVKGLNQKYKKK